MRSLKSLFSFVIATALLTAALAGIGHETGLSPFLTVPVGLLFSGLLSLIKTTGQPDTFVAGVQKEIWTNHIIGNLFKDNEFLEKAYNADEYVLAGKVVHIPQAAAPSNVVKNRSSFPATVTRRTDTDVTYPLDEYTTDPRAIPHADTVELSYDKRESVLSEDQMALKETVAENMLINWSPSTAGSILRTTGDATAAHTPSATGNRKLLTVADFRAAMKQFNRWGIAKSERFCLLDADMYDQLVSQLTETQYRDFSRALDEKNGIVGQLFTFKIYCRSTVLVFDNAATPVVKPYGAAGAATDNAAALFWQQQCVERALGEVVMFDQMNSPAHYADIYSFLLRMGGRIRRADQKGVLAMVQAAAA